ncbi:MAG TPA: glycosyltransferase family 4 protein [Anaerolineales bacterium]|nr:glycosyltransferase family 4 protein [Anaerolineales bacterium]
MTSKMNSHPGLTHRRIGFVSTRFAGTDGVSLETEKWAAVLERLSHTCFYFAGQCDRPAERSRVVPEAFFGHEAIDAIAMAAFSDDWGAPELVEFANPEIYDIYTTSYSSRLRPPNVTRRIHELADYLQKQLYAFVRDFELELLIVENALTIPMNIPLGLALTEFIAETGFPTIAHHHDFYWERQRFLVNCVADYLSMAFPPNLPSIRHVVINSLAAQQLSLRTGLSAMLIPNVMDFEHPPAPPDEYARDVYAALGLAPDERLFLQPTRVVQRKGIEHAIELTRRLGLKARLIISHASGDENDNYERRVREFAEMLAVPVNFVSDIIRDRRGQTPDGRKIYTLWDVYPHANLVTYPSTLEGFGNAFLEAVYFRKPIAVNNYSIFDVDIKPKGFRVIEFDGYITETTLRQTRQVLADSELARQMAEENYRLAKRYYSYAVLKRRLQTLIADCFGEEDDH